MGQNPLNLALRFILEILALVAIGYWGWTTNSGVLRYLLAFGAPLLAAVLWATFRAAGDASGGEPIVPVPGWLRLLLEGAMFVFATWGLYRAGAVQATWLFGGVTLFHYLISYDRIAWLLRH